MRRQLHLTKRNLTADVETEREPKRGGTPTDQTVVDAPTSNGLATLGGTWTEEEFAAFEQSIRELDDVPWL